ncbi:patatin-like phospholipase family protein [Acinetobacter guillouiae]|jgi:NTE family protein|uniref:patatin-like phospholipase family protein n=1 Tax=Acinetobacter TaxID=469 RepID=UPI0006FE79BD|nr:patatin-like phospholipase family protein [Acinetobacter sp. RIT698]KQW98090.1 alpha/beta hydrolase [Acinetobacter sp. Root1280]MCS4300528.1 NTE family protein [Acinetobacter guillouiae]MCW2253866.1 NTE family protein [Acinetobacter sp. BIGb0204]NII38715.1 NTE family protein [Acinetobacter sp. BIGb0196]QLD61459.1 patatin-like phospholipase family protein [Acinetobacter sp. MYb10]
MSLLKKTLASLFCGLLLTACAHTPEKKSQASRLAPQQVLEASSRLDNTFYQYKQLSKKKPVIALVLGSGGARGYAHIGVIEVLEQHGIKPDFIVGTSAGSIVGSIYASGKSPEQLRQIALNMKVGDVRDFKIGMKGFFDGQKVEDYVNKQIDQMPLEKMKIPMYVVATELQNGEKTIFNYGNTGQAVRASVSIPSMFIPTKIKGKEYVDGGLVSPVPVNIAKELGADIVIAVDILAQPVNTETTNVWGLFNQNINIMQNRLAAEELKNADIVIQPDLREKAHIFDVKGRQDTMQAGIDAANQRMHDLDVVIASKKSLETAQQQYQVQN